MLRASVLSGLGLRVSGFGLVLLPALLHDVCRFRGLGRCCLFRAV